MFHADNCRQYRQGFFDLPGSRGCDATADDRLRSLRADCAARGSTSGSTRLLLRTSALPKKRAPKSCQGKMQHAEERALVRVAWPGRSEAAMGRRLEGPHPPVPAAGAGCGRAASGCRNHSAALYGGSRGGAGSCHCLLTEVTGVGSMWLARGFPGQREDGSPGSRRDRPPSNQKAATLDPPYRRLLVPRLSDVPPRPLSTRWAR